MTKLHVTGQDISVNFKVGDLDLSGIDTASIIDAIAPKVVKVFQDEIGPQIVNVAKDRCPVGKDKKFAPKINSKAFEKVSLAKKLPFKADRSPESTRRFQALRSGSAEPNTSDAEFFRTKSGQTPDKIAFRHGALVGAVKHQPGTLKESIRIAEVRREGSRVTLVVRAHAPYAYAVHQGFEHKSGWSAKAKANSPSTYVKGKPFLAQALRVNALSALAGKSLSKG